MQKVLRKARKGTHVVFVPGNHDEVGAPFCGLNVRRHRDPRAKPSTACRRPAAVGGARRLRPTASCSTPAGSRTSATPPTTSCSALNRHFNNAARAPRLPYWSLSQYLKHRVKNAVELHHRLRDRADARGAPARLRRRRLRPHPQGRDAHHRRRALLQRRRLGREPDRAGRARSTASSRSSTWKRILAPDQPVLRWNDHDDRTRIDADGRGRQRALA